MNPQKLEHLEPAASRSGAAPAGTKARPYRLGVVSYLNARPLCEAFEDRPEARLEPAVPSALAPLLREDRCDVALLPVVDYWRERASLQIVSDACIGCDGETMTVRVFAKRPADKISLLHVDGDSHTSIILAQLIWRTLYDRELELAEWRPDDPATLEEVEAVLLIGDKVVNNAPTGFGFEVDLGAAWKYHTGLPFVFAAWCGRADRDFERLAVLLAEARDRGQADAERIAREAAPAHGWPEAAAVHYLCSALKFTLTDAMRSGMDRFFRLAIEHGLLP
ncbi:MAG: menaquinone biosynthetic enzyme MqnA/MqnD family protein [Phycisphaerae bacterium]